METLIFDNLPEKVKECLIENNDYRIVNKNNVYVEMNSEIIPLNNITITKDGILPFERIFYLEGMFYRETLLDVYFYDNYCLMPYNIDGLPEIFY